MFDGWSPWTWVALSWLLLAVSYGGYFMYMRGKARKLEDEL